MPILQKTSLPIAKFLLLGLLIFGNIPAKSQSPVKLQITYPVFFEDVAYPHLHDPAKPPIGELCGIALLFLDTAKVQDEIIVTGLEDPVIWVDKAGISTLAKFVVADSAGSVSLELLYSNGVCAVNILAANVPLANGILAKERGVHKIRLVGRMSEAKRIVGLLEKLNTHLLKLHTKDQKKIPISPLYNSEAVNVILGPDDSFGTNFELLWFDAGLLQRLKELAAHTHFSVNTGLKDRHKQAENRALVQHVAEKVPGRSHLTKGRVTAKFKVESGSSYFFLRPGQEYLIEVGYHFEQWPFGDGRFMVDHFTVKNSGNGDFVSMEVLDFNWNGLPILYIDLIKGVVMEDGGAWKADQVLTVVEEVFRLVELPNE